MKRVLLKTLQPAIVMRALCVASITFSLGAYAMPASAPPALMGASDQTNLTEVVHCGYDYGCGYDHHPYRYYRPYYRQYVYYRPHRYYSPYFSYPYRLPPPVR
jgi:hypothetical protein